MIDSMVLIYLFEDAPKYAALCDRILKEVTEWRYRGVITPVTVAELLVKPLENDRKDIADTYRRGIRSLPNIELASMTFETGCLAGALRAKYHLPLPDMIQTAFALQSFKPAMITNDKALRRVQEMQVFLLDEML